MRSGAPAMLPDTAYVHPLDCRRYMWGRFDTFLIAASACGRVLLQAVPYWIDDASLMPYMLMCAEPTSENNEEASAKERTRGARRARC